MRLRKAMSRRMNGAQHAAALTGLLLAVSCGDESNGGEAATSATPGPSIGPGPSGLPSGPATTTAPASSPSVPVSGSSPTSSNPTTSDPTNPAPPATLPTATDGAGGQGGNPATPGNGMGGSAGTGGSVTSPSGGAGGEATSPSSGGSGGLGAGGGGGPGPSGWACPAGVTASPSLGGTPMRIASVPPADAFNMNNGTFGIIEGPVWTGSELYLSEIGNQTYAPGNSDWRQSRLLRVSPDGQTSIVVADSGTNGLAIDADGSIVAGVHGDGSIKRFTLPDGGSVDLVTDYMGARFNSPNDLAIHGSGTIYFSDPAYNAPTPAPQAAMRVYQVAPNTNTAEPVPSGDAPDSFSNPNGVTLSLAEDYLYVAAGVGRRYPVMADGALGAGEDWPASSGGDGMVVDCAGNLYVAVSNSSNVAVFSPEGNSLGTISVSGMQSVTNVAFGGEDRQTLYITGLGNDKGLYALPLNLPGRPY